jgi:hypothetical protein
MSSTAAQQYRQKIEKKLERAIEVATRRALVGDFEAAEEIVRHAERPFTERTGIPRLYASAIASLGGQEAAAINRPIIRAMFDRLIHRPPLAHPDPHTQEEAERYTENDAREHARVVKLVGVDPNHWPADRPEAVEAAALARQRATSSRKKRSSMLVTILSIAAMLIGVGASLTMILMFFAGAANSDPIQIRQMKWMVASVILVQFVALGGAIGLLVVDRGWLACGAGLLPALYAVILTVVLVRLEW